MRKLYQVNIDGKPYSPEFQTAALYEKAWQGVLASNHPLSELGRTAFCCCPGLGEKRLTIKAYGTSSYGLAKFSGTGPQHASSCKYHEEHVARSGLQIYHKVLEEFDDGTVSVKLQKGLRMQAPRLESWVERTPRAGATHQRGSMTLRGLLDLLWTRAGLNEWSPHFQYNRHAPFGRLVEAAGEIRCGRQRVLSDHLIVGQSVASEGAQGTRRAVAAATSKGLRLLCPLSLSKHDPTAEDKMASALRGFPYHGLPWMNMPAGLWDAACKRFPLAISHWRAGGKLVALAMLEVQGPDRTKVVGLALMAVSDHWIPVESSYELQVCNALVQQGRSFYKPLRFDATADVVFPDFILRDGLNRDGVPMEVFGRDDAAYRARKATKTQYYVDNFGAEGWWQWDASSNQAMPPFPPMRGHA